MIYARHESNLTLKAGRVMTEGYAWPCYEVRNHAPQDGVVHLSRWRTYLIFFWRNTLHCDATAHRPFALLCDLRAGLRFLVGVA